MHLGGREYAKKRKHFAAQCSMQNILTDGCGENRLFRLGPVHAGCVSDTLAIVCNRLLYFCAVVNVSPNQHTMQPPMHTRTKAMDLTSPEVRT